MKVCVDFGTSVTKIVATRERTIVARKSFPTELLRGADGSVTVDVAGLVASTSRALRAMALTDVSSLVLTGQGDGLWLLDGSGAPLGRASTWLDGRGADRCRDWDRSGALQTIFGETANAPFPGAGAALLAARAEAGGLACETAATATQCQHAIFEMLTGVRTATRSCAMLPLLDPRRGQYSERAIAACGLSGLQHLLPPISPDAVASAALLPSAAHDMGLSSNTTVSTGPYDLPAAALGAGLTARGDGLLIIGTTLASLVKVDQVGTDGSTVGLTLRAADDRGYLRAMPAMVGTAALDWVAELLKVEHSDLGSLLSRSATGASGVRVLPYFSPSGERAPFSEPRARAEIVGLDLTATPADVVRAVCESLAFAARQCLEAAGWAGAITVAGGGSRTREFLTILATVLDKPVTVAVADSTAVGALLAADPQCSDRGASMDVPSVIEPDVSEGSVYQDLYIEYCQRVAAARLRWKEDERV